MGLETSQRMAQETSNRNIVTFHRKKCFIMDIFELLYYLQTTIHNFHF